MYVIYLFTVDTPHGKSPRTKLNILSLIRFVPLDQIHKIKIFHMVVSEHTKVIEEMWRLIDTDILDPDEASEDGSIYNDGDALYKEDGSGSGEAGMITGVTQSVTEEAEEVQRFVKYSSLLSYILKPTSLLTQVFKYNKKAHENLFNRVCNFGARAEWTNGRRSVSSYLDVISNDQYRLLNTTPLECITGYILEDEIDDRDLKSLPQRRMKLINGYISSYCSMIKQ